MLLLMSEASPQPKGVEPNCSLLSALKCINKTFNIPAEYLLIRSRRSHGHQAHFSFPQGIQNSATGFPTFVLKTLLSYIFKDSSKLKFMCFILIFLD